MGGISEERQVLDALRALKDGDLSVRLPDGGEGIAGEIAAAFNAHLEQMNALMAQIGRIAREVRPDSRLGGQAEVRDLSGAWEHLQVAVNRMAYVLTDQVRNAAQVCGRLAEGDLSRAMTVEARGEMAGLKDNINRLRERLQGDSA